MRKTFAIISLVLSSNSFAAGAYGTVADFAKSSFCSKWTCTFVSKSAHNGEVSYEYSLDDGAEITVRTNIKSKKLIDFMAIYKKDAFQSIIDNRGTWQVYMPDLIKWLTGASGDMNLYNECIEPLSRLPSVISTPRKFGQRRINCLAGPLQDAKGGILFLLLYDK